jgi:hypothetical protein
MREVVENGRRYKIRNGQKIEVEEYELDLPPSRRRNRTDAFAIVPLDWAVRAAKATKTPATLIINYLQYLAWRANGKSFTLSNEWLAKQGVSRKVKTRVLRDLEAGGLIKIERAPGRAPLISLIDR